MKAKDDSEQLPRTRVGRTKHLIHRMMSM